MRRPPNLDGGVMPLTLACGLCPLRIRMSGTVSYWWCPSCGCYNAHGPEDTDG